MTRAEHLAWAKQRAIGEIELGNRNGALSSIMQDFADHPELKDHDGPMLGFKLAMGGFLNTDDEMRAHINGLA